MVGTRVLISGWMPTHPTFTPWAGAKPWVTRSKDRLPLPLQPPGVRGQGWALPPPFLPLPVQLGSPYLYLPLRPPQPRPSQLSLRHLHLHPYIPPHSLYLQLLIPPPPTLFPPPPPSVGLGKGVMPLHRQRAWLPVVMGAWPATRHPLFPLLLLSLHPRLHLLPSPFGIPRRRPHRRPLL